MAKPPAAPPQRSTASWTDAAQSPPICSEAPDIGHDEYRLMVPLLVSVLWGIPSMPIVSGDSSPPAAASGEASWAAARMTPPIVDADRPSAVARMTKLDRKSTRLNSSH